MAIDTLLAQECHCGCGQPKHVAHDPDTAGRWQVEVDICQARAALAEFHERHAKDGLEPGALTWVRLLPEGEEPVDRAGYDPARAAEEYERHQRSLGLLD